MPVVLRSTCTLPWSIASPLEAGNLTIKLKRTFCKKSIRLIEVCNHDEVHPNLPGGLKSSCPLSAVKPGQCYHIKQTSKQSQLIQPGKESRRQLEVRIFSMQPDQERLLCQQRGSMSSSQPLNISPALILQFCLPDSHVYDKASLGCASTRRGRGTHWHTLPPAQESKCTVLLPSACSRLSCPWDAQCHVCVLTGTPSALSTVRSLASLIYVNIKYCYSEVIFWLDLCDLKDL